jgi:hypothetical protein
MAGLSHYTIRTLAAAAGGLNLPTLPVTAAYVRACNGNAAEWEDRWHRVTDAIKAGDGGTPEPGGAADRTAGGCAPGGTGAGPAENGPTENGPDNGAPRGTASREPAGQRVPRLSQVASPGPARDGPSAPDPAPPRPPDPGPEQVYVITSAAPRRPYR